MQANGSVLETHRPPPMGSESVLSARLFPDLRRLLSPVLSPPDNQPPSPQNASSDLIAEVLASYATLGPFLPRLISNDALNQPMFTVRLQRDADSHGTSGQMTIGGFPQELETERIVWTYVRGYPPSQGGLQAPSNAPEEVCLMLVHHNMNLTIPEVYPIAWEIPIDDVFLDGCKIPRSSLSSPNISLSALLDTVRLLFFHASDVI